MTSPTTAPLPTCWVCGAAFHARRRDARYCSTACRNVARARRRADACACRGCGRQFTPSSSTQYYCDDGCRKRAERRRRYARQRKEQGIEVRSTGARDKVAREAARKCATCSRAFTPERSTQVYCSAECRTRAGRVARRHSSRTAAYRACEIIVRMHVPDIDGTCSECGHAWPCETRRIAYATIAKGDER